jgi:hypothetical protein
MRYLASVMILMGAAMLVGCASSLKPEQFGFRHVAIAGREYLCAPPEVVVPPYVPLSYPIAARPLPGTDVVNGGYPPTREVCLTQAQWPQWLILRTRDPGQWPITPGAGEALASR